MQRGGDQEELPQVRGQGRRPRMPGCDTAGAAERTYPASEVRGSGREELPHIEVRGGGREELPQLRGQGRQPRMPSYLPAPGRTSWVLRIALHLVWLFHCVSEQPGHG